MKFSHSTPWPPPLLLPATFFFPKNFSGSCRSKEMGKGVKLEPVDLVTVTSDDKSVKEEDKTQNETCVY